MANEPFNVLLIEDNPGDVRLIRGMLAGVLGTAYHLESCDRLSAGLERLAGTGIDVVLLDLLLPDSQGLETFSRVHARAPEVPVVVLTGLGDETVAVKAVQAGAQDYLVKGHVDGNLLVRSLRYAIERNRSEEAVRFQKSLLEAQSEASIDGILMIGNDGTMLSHNRRFVEMWDISDDVMATLSDEATLNSVKEKLVDPEEFLARVAYLYRHPEEESHEEIRLKDGRTLDRYSAPIRMPNGGYYGRVWFFRDITEREQLERQFRQAQKMEAVGRVTGGIAHDFNNMLEIVLGYSHLLLADTSRADPRREGLEVIQDVTERAGQLTRQLLVFSRRQVPAPRVLDVNEIVAHLEQMLGRVIGEDVRLATVLDPTLAPVKADAGQLEQVIMNLVVNARDAMPHGGRLTIETANVDRECPVTWPHNGAQPGGEPPLGSLAPESRGADGEAHPRATDSASGHHASRHRPLPPAVSRYVMLAVSDTGCGMDAETQSHLFEPFFTTKAPGEGTGLGLATVYGIVRQSGGHIDVESELGRGSTFRIYLPRSEATVASLGAAEAPAGLSPGSEMILLVENDPRVRRLVREMLRRSGYSVLEAGKAEEAARICGQYEGPIHLLLTDVVMPDMGGHEVAQRVAVLRPEIKVLYMSGSPDAAILLQDLLGAGTAFLPKPFTPAVLGRKVREVLGEEG
jgi:PAS domain S-box-containing protein